MSSSFWITAVATFFGLLLFESLLLKLARLTGLYAIVPERRCHVYVLFGNVVGVLDEPGIYCLWTVMGWPALIVNWIGRLYEVDMRLDQQYLRSQPVNSEEGAPMGIGIWYEMFISDPVAFLFKNVDPRGSLAANVSNSTVRCLSNMPLAQMMSDRHAMSQTVRDEVSPQSHEWGYKLGSAYIRKVHFRDAQMIKRIEDKVVNRLRQVTSAILQDGANQVDIITSAAERQAAVEFAKAAAVRPAVVGEALREIARDPELCEAMFTILESQRILEGNAELTLLPRHRQILGDLLAAAAGKKTQAAKPVNPS